MCTVVGSCRSFNIQRYKRNVVGSRNCIYIYISHQFTPIPALCQSWSGPGFSCEGLTATVRGVRVVRCLWRSRSEREALTGRCLRAAVGAQSSVKCVCRGQCNTGLSGHRGKHCLDHCRDSLLHTFYLCYYTVPRTTRFILFRRISSGFQQTWLDSNVYMSQSQQQCSDSGTVAIDSFRGRCDLPSVPHCDHSNTPVWC